MLYLNKFNPKNILIHDAARPLIKNDLIKKLIKQLNTSDVCTPYINYQEAHSIVQQF